MQKQTKDTMSKAKSETPQTRAELISGVLFLGAEAN